MEVHMRVVIIGAVAGGTSAAAKARRNLEDAEIVIYEKDSFISYSGCSMPYFIGGVIKDRDDLSPRDPQFFKSKYNVDVKIGHEVLSIDSATKSIQVKELSTGRIFTDAYDKLILSTGAKAWVPPIEGADLPHVFTLRNLTNMDHIVAFVAEKNPTNVVIIGTGFIGLECCENFVHLGMTVTMIEKLPSVTPNMDEDVGLLIQDHLTEKHVKVYTNAGTAAIEPTQVRLEDGTVIPAELVIVSTGIKPEVALAKEAGVELGPTGAISVTPTMETSIPDIYACGDCAEHYHLITGKPVWRPLGSTANKTGRIAGDAATGGDLAFRGILGTGIFKVFDLSVAMTGLTERDAIAEGYDVEVCHNTKSNKPENMGGQDMLIKAMADRSTGKMLGAQIVGKDGVDKRIDVFATALTYGALAEDLFHLDLAYSPPFSNTKDPVMYTGMILDNAIRKGRKLILPKELDKIKESGQKVQIIDTRVPTQYMEDHLEDAISIPHEQVRSVLSNENELDKEALTVTYCNKGVTGNAVQNILLNKGFKNVANLSGGHKNYRNPKKK
jgi:NADPH-dependent 2,4-dienoyl-CoA reductase/sulfur reductase-like enzyme/rhodanese-related sulfurtransferase